MPYATTTRTGEAFNAGFERGGRVLVDPAQSAKVADMFITVYKHDASVAREGIVNGKESVMDAFDRYGKAKQKVVVTIPTSQIAATGDFDNTLTITDYGLGLTLDEFENTVMWFGRSTKDGSTADDRDPNGRKYVGGKGIGAKSGAYISSPFFYEIAKDGVLNRVEVFTDEEGMGWNLLSTDEDYAGPDQVKMIVPFPEDAMRLSHFRDEMTILMRYFSKDDVECPQIDTLGEIADAESFGNVTFARRYRSSTGYLSSVVVPTVKGAPYSYAYSLPDELSGSVADDYDRTTPAGLLALASRDAILGGNVTIRVELDHDDVQIPADRESLSTLTRTSKKITDSITSALDEALAAMLEEITDRHPSITGGTDLTSLHPVELAAVIADISDVISETFGSDWVTGGTTYRLSSMFHSNDSVSVSSLDELVIAPSDKVVDRVFVKTPFRTDLKAFKTFRESGIDGTEDVCARHSGVKTYTYTGQYVNVVGHARLGRYSLSSEPVSLDSLYIHMSDEKKLAGEKFQEDRRRVNAVYRKLAVKSDSPSNGGRPHVVSRLVDGRVDTVMMNLKEVRAMAAAHPADSVILTASRGQSIDYKHLLNKALLGYEDPVVIQFKTTDPIPVETGAAVVYHGRLSYHLVEKLTGREYDRDNIEHRLFESMFHNTDRLGYYHRQDRDVMAHLLLVKLGVVKSDLLTPAGVDQWLGGEPVVIGPELLKSLSKVSDCPLPRYDGKKGVEFVIKVPAASITTEKLIEISTAANALSAAA